MATLQDLPAGTKVKVVRDYEAEAANQPSDWVGATGIVDHVNAFDRNVTIIVTSGGIYPEDGKFAWFTPDELEVQS